ncbi:MAG: acetyl-CoA acetyltransferase, partial [Gammaproteobacteria bacterium]
TERPLLSTSIAQGQALRTALDNGGLTAGDLDHLDLYSCFPVAVWSACEHLGLNPSDQALTVTGGLPFFGGPGNNYSLHAIAEMMSRIRAAPQSHGMVAANGGYLSKHSVGIYTGHVHDVPRAAVATQPLPPPVRVTERATGAARIESVAAIYQRSVPSSGVIIGRLDDDSRILALPADIHALAALFRDDVCDRHVAVTHRENLNYFNLL